MRIVLFTEGEFPLADAERIRGWVREYSRVLAERGLVVELFAPAESRLAKDDLVHVFGLGRPENWYWLKRLAARVVVSPLPLSHAASFAAMRRAPSPMHRLRRALRIGNVSPDPAAFVRAVDGFYVFGPSSPLPPPPVPSRRIPGDAAGAAESMIEHYASHR